MRASPHIQLCVLAIAWAAFSAACGQSSPAGNGIKSCSDPKADHSDCKFAVTDLTTTSAIFIISTDNPFDKVKIVVRHNSEWSHQVASDDTFTSPPYMIDRLTPWWDINWPKWPRGDQPKVPTGEYAAEAILFKDGAQIEQMTLEFRTPAVPVHRRIEFYLEAVIMYGGGYYTTEDPNEQAALFVFWPCGYEASRCTTGAWIARIPNETTWDFDPSDGTFRHGDERGQVFACDCNGYLPSYPHLREECRAIGNPQEADCVDGIRIRIIYPDREENYHRRHP